MHRMTTAIAVSGKISTLIPSAVVIHGDYWSEATPEERDQLYEGLVIAIFNDSSGDMWCAFEMPDQAGVQLIHMGSRFFKGFAGAP